MEYIGSIIFLLIAVPFAIAGLSMAPWVPTRRKDIQRFLEIIELKKGETFLEIGTGDGRVASAVAKKFPDANIWGIEIMPLFFILGYFRKILGRQKNFSLQLGNAFQKDFGSYDVIYVFGMPDKMQDKIIPKFLEEAKVGAKLYSYVFSIPEKYQEYARVYGGEHEAKIHILEKK